MANPTLCYLYRETRLNLDPTSPTATIRFNLPNQSSFGRLGLRTAPKQSVNLTDEDIDQSEEAFANRHLASEVSIFFRRESSSPRCIFWRLLHGRQLLELQVVDLTLKKGQERNIKFTLNFHFPAAVRPFGIAFAELEDQDAFNVFALTAEKELYTLTIHKSFFISQTATDGKLSDWCKIYTHPAFGYRLPYRIFAVCHNELLISLQDGGILRLDQSSKDTSWTWKDFIYSPGEAGWGASIRGLIPWADHNLAQFEDLTLQATASAAIALSPEGNHLFTVCLNNILRIRDHKSGGVCAQLDLNAEDNRETKSNPRQLMSPGQRSLLQIVKPDITRDGDSYYAVTYSPKDHQFKFWGVRDADEAVNGIYDTHPELKLVPPVDQLLNTSAWNLEEFHVKPTHFLQSTELWIRARVGPASQVFAIKFNLFDDEHFLEKQWQNDWVTVHGGAMDASALKLHPTYPNLEAAKSFAKDGDEVTEKALGFIFYPERFTSATLESALYRYRIGLGLPSSRVQYLSDSIMVPLRQRICEAVGAKACLGSRAGDDQGLIDYGSYQSKTAEQWNVFAGLILDLHRLRHEALSLAYDLKTGLPWLCSTDYISPIRRCSEIELLELNEGFLSQDGEQLAIGPLARSLQDRESIAVASLLSIASSFCQGLPQPVKETLASLAAVEAFHDPFVSPDERIQTLYHGCDFAEQITEEDLSRLSTALEAIGGLPEVNNELFRCAMKRLDPDTDGTEQALSLLTYGARLLVRGAQETLDIGRNVLLELLLLAVVMAIDFDQNELPSNFVPAQIYGEIMNRLREHELLRFLASTSRVEPQQEQSLTEKSTSHSGFDTVHKSGEDHYHPIVTLLWSIFIGDWKSIPAPDTPNLSAPSLLTYWIRSWALGADLSGNYNSVASHIMANLLVCNDYELASDFIPFLPNTPWATYLKSRLHLEKDELAEAARGFKKASFGLSRISKIKAAPGAEQLKDVQHWDGSGLLAPHEMRYFNEGNVGLYYQHVAGLFERSRPQAWTYVAEFSRKAIWHFEQKRFMRKVAGIDDFDVIDRKRFGTSQHHESQGKRKSIGGDKYTQRSPLGLRNSSPGNIENRQDVQPKDESDDSLENSMALIDYSIAELSAIKDFEAKQESLGRLFTALVKTGRWEEAYSTLVRYEKPDL